MLFRVARENQGQSAVAGDIACGSEGILQRKDGQHERCAALVKAEHAGNQSERSHDGAAGHAGCADCEYAEQQTEEYHLTDGRELAVEHLGNCHDKEGLGHNRAAEMNVCKERNTEVHEVIAECRLGLSCALQSYGERCCGGHGADCGHVSGAVVLDDIHAVSAGIDACDSVEQGEPEIVAYHDNYDDNQENRELLCDAALIRQRAEGGSDEQREHRNQELRDNRENNLLELFENVGGNGCVIPDSCESHRDREEECGHDAHNRRNLELEDNVRKLLQSVNVRIDREMRQDCEAGNRRRESCADRRDIGNQQGEAEHSGSVVAHTRDGGCNKADDDERNTEANELSGNVFHRDNDV